MSLDDMTPSQVFWRSMVILVLAAVGVVLLLQESVPYHTLGGITVIALALGSIWLFFVRSSD